jgi:ATP-dependent DNA ligase
VPALAADAELVDRPVAAALARAVARLTHGPSCWYEPKFDGHRVVLFRDEDTLVLQTRSGRDVTGVWPDLAAAEMRLEPGTVLDGETVIVAQAAGGGDTRVVAAARPSAAAVRR